MKPWILWLWGKVWRRHTLPAMWPIRVDLERWGWQLSLGGSLGALKMPHFSHQNIWVALHPPLEVSGWGFVMSRLTQGHYWLGKWFADLIKHKGVAPWGGVYIYMGAQGLCRRTLGVFKIAKVIRKPKGSSVTREQLTPYPGQKDEDLLSTEVQKKCQSDWTHPSWTHPSWIHPRVNELTHFRAF